MRHGMNEADYTPIDCSLHDRLEAAATLRRRVLLRYDAGDEQVEENGGIVDIRTRAGAEYLVLSSGTEVRLDRIVSMDGLPFRQQS